MAGIGLNHAITFIGHPPPPSSAPAERKGFASASAATSVTPRSQQPKDGAEPNRADVTYGEVDAQLTEPAVADVYGNGLMPRRVEQANEKLADFLGGSR